MGNIIGIAFPFGSEPGSIPGESRDEQSLLDSIRQIIESSRFERLMRPNSGSDVMQLAFENNDSLLRPLIVDTVRRAIRAQEPRVEVVKVDAVTTDSAVVVTVLFRRLGSLFEANIPLERANLVE